MLAATVVMSLVAAVVPDDAQVQVVSPLFATTISTIKRIKDNKASTKMTIFHKRGTLLKPPNRTIKEKLESLILHTQKRLVGICHIFIFL